MNFTDYAMRFAKETAMRRLRLSLALTGVRFTGCQFTANPNDAGTIPDTQFLRPAREPVTGTWVAAWTNPEGFQFSSVADQPEETE